MQFWETLLSLPQSTLLVTEHFSIIYPTHIYNTFKCSTSETIQRFINPACEAQSLGSRDDVLYFYAMVPNKTCLRLEVYEWKRKIMGTTCAALIIQRRDQVTALRPWSIQEGKGRGGQLAHRNQNSHRVKDGPGSVLQDVLAYPLSFWDISC